LSRTVSRKFIVWLTLGSSSDVVVVLLRMLASRGNVRVGLVVAVNDRNRGLLPLSAALRGWAGPVSYCSQL
jgi:hypothetical protein